MAKSKKNFAQTLKELENILESIEGEEVDIDDLADQVERASVLIATCRKKIEQTQTRIGGAISSLKAEEKTQVRGSTEEE